tara:strand:- start:502 stop:654 length:153 start_codon:yes stop_codon:yes gene_type:complete
MYIENINIKENKMRNKNSRKVRQYNFQKQERTKEILTQTATKDEKLFAIN